MPNATNKATPVSAENGTRFYDPLDPPRFGEWVRVGGLESDESDRTTRREARVVLRARPWKNRRVVFVALLLALGAAFVAAFSLNRHQPNIESKPGPQSTPAKATSPKSTLSKSNDSKPKAFGKTANSQTTVKARTNEATLGPKNERRSVKLPKSKRHQSPSKKLSHGSTAKPQF